MFNKELFYSLCQKYEVDLSDKIDVAMIKDGDKIKSLNEEEIKKIFSNFTTYFSFGKSKITTLNESSSSFEILEYPIAC